MPTLKDLDQALFKEGLRSKKKIPKASPIDPPSAIERQYFQTIKKILNQIASIYGELLDELAPISEKIEKDIPQIRKDSGEKDITKIVNRIRLQVGSRYSREELEKIIGKDLSEVKKYNRKNAKKLFDRVSGMDLFIDDSPLETLMGLATANNVNLIQTLISEAQGKVENIVYEGFRSGVRHEEIAKQIKKYIDPKNENVKGNVAYRAKFIARDQVTKLNAEISKTRQNELGVRRYIWRTSRDERVRDSHRRKEGEIFSWDNPPADTGHPGEDFNCRCTAEPVIEDLL